MLLECLVYTGVLTIILGLGGTAFYLCWDNARDLHRVSDDITRVTLIDGREVMARVRRERDRFVGFVLEGVDAISETDRIRGYARFVDARTLQVEGFGTIHARSVVIATGSRPAIAPLLANLGDRLVVNDDVFDWDDLPRSVAVFGPG